MTDKERILFNIIKRLSLTYANTLEWGKEREYGVYFAPWYDILVSESKLKPGMLVLCQTGRVVHEWTIGLFLIRLYGRNMEKINIELNEDKDCRLCIHFDICGIYSGVSHVLDQNWNFIDDIWGDMFIASICKSYKEREDEM